MMPAGPPALDALLMAAVALRDNLPPLGFGHRAEIEIPVAQERGVYLASIGQCEAEAHERRFVNKRFPVLEAQMLATPKLRRILTAGGLSKGYRIPSELVHLRDDTMTFYAVGDAEQVRDLLACIHYLGKRRGVGHGKIVRWEVEQIDAWEGFPVLREGRPIRPLPLDWPGLGEHRREFRVPSPPYWERWREEEMAVPC